VELGELVGLGIVSALAAMLGSMLGLGGGVFMVPIFTLFFGIDQKFAIGASAIAVVANSVVGSTVHLSGRMTNIRLAMLLQVTTAIGATIGALFSVGADPSIVNAIFGALLLYVALSMIQNARSTSRRAKSAADTPPRAPDSRALALHLDATFEDAATHRTVHYVPRHVQAGAGLSGLAGLLSGMLGIGGGVVQVPLMNLLMGIPVKAAAGTSSFMVGLSAVATSSVYYAAGQVNPQVVVPAILGIFVGSQVGPRLTRRLPTDRLVLVFVIILLYLGGSLILEAIGVELPWQ
jgi:uncharacterized membrane protein YfcA